MNFSTSDQPNAAIAATSDAASPLASGPIDVVWHSELGEKTWVMHLLSRVDQVRHVDIAAWQPTNRVPSIHVVSTNIAETKDRICSLFAELHRKGLSFAIFHMSDEWFREDTSFYKYARFVLRNYWCTFIKNRDLYYVPLGYPTCCNFDPATVLPASVRKHRASFKGQLKYSRFHALQAFRDMEGFYYPHTFLSDADYVEMMRQTVFSICPMGNTTPDTWRFYESLEAGAVPIVEKRPTLNYFEGLFGKNPIPTFGSWKTARNWVENLKSPEELDQIQRTVQKWWREQKFRLQHDLAAMVNEKFAPSYQSALENYKPAYSGALLKLRWKFELMRHLNLKSIPLRIMHNTGMRRVKSYGAPT